jgi:hypothetical protein
MATPSGSGDSVPQAFLPNEPISFFRLTKRDHFDPDSERLWGSDSEQFEAK